MFIKVDRTHDRVHYRVFANFPLLPKPVQRNSLIVDTDFVFSFVTLCRTMKESKKLFIKIIKKAIMKKRNFWYTVSFVYMLLSISMKVLGEKQKRGFRIEWNLCSFMEYSNEYHDF